MSRAMGWVARVATATLLWTGVWSSVYARSTSSESDSLCVCRRLASRKGAGVRWFLVLRWRLCAGPPESDTVGALEVG